MRRRWFQVSLMFLIISALMGMNLPVRAEDPVLYKLEAISKPGQTMAIINPGSILRSKANYVVADEPTRYTNEQIEGAVTAVADPNGILDNALDGDGPVIEGRDYGRVGLGFLSAYEMTAFLGTLIPVNAAVQHDADSTAYLDQSRLIADDFVDPLKLMPTQSTDAIFLNGIANIERELNNLQSAASYQAAGVVCLSNFKSTYNTGSAVKDFYDLYVGQHKIWNMASWVEAAQLYGETAWADEIMTEILALQDNMGGFYYEVNQDDEFLVRTSGQAKVVEVLKRFYEEEHETERKQGLAYLRALQSDTIDGDQATSQSGLFTAFGTTNAAQTMMTPGESICLDDQSAGISAMAYNLQTTWKNFNDNKGPYWGSMSLLKYFRNGGLNFADAAVSTILPGNFADPCPDSNGDAFLALYLSCKEGDVTKTGQIEAYDALLTLRTWLGPDYYTDVWDSSINRFEYGPSIVAAYRKRITGIDVTHQTLSGCAVTILKASVGNPNHDIDTFLYYYEPPV